MIYLTLDIETVKNERAHDFFFKDNMAKPDARIKDEEKIRLNLEEQFDKSALRWYLGKVVCICATVYNDYTKETLETFDGIHTNEKLLLENFGNFIEDMVDKYQIVEPLGKSSKMFDFPFLVGRYLYHDLGLPSVLYGTRPINDIDEIFIRYGRCDQTTSLNNYAWGLGIEGKLDKEGGCKVQTWYDAEEFTTIKDYCRQDVNICVEILKRYRPFKKTTTKGVTNVT